jgi:high-affinity iron transporter
MIGLFSKAVWNFEMNAWSKLTGGDAAETGSGPGSYDIRQSVWHVNCCNPELNGGGGWGIFNSILGWTNSATYGSVISYNLYVKSKVKAQSVSRSLPLSSWVRDRC